MIIKVNYKRNLLKQLNQTLESTLKANAQSHPNFTQIEAYIKSKRTYLKIFSYVYNQFKDQFSFKESSMHFILKIITYLNDVKRIQERLNTQSPFISISEENISKIKALGNYEEYQKLLQIL